MTKPRTQPLADLRARARAAIVMSELLVEQSVAVQAQLGALTVPLLDHPRRFAQRRPMSPAGPAAGGVRLDAGEWEGPGETAIIPLMRRRAGAFAARAGFAGERLEDLGTCVSEGVTNAVVHAFRDGRPPGTVRMSVRLSRHELIVRVRDDGVGFGPRTDSPGLGLGLKLIGALATSASIRPGRRAGAELRMTFRRPAVDDAAATRRPAPAARTPG